MTGFVPNAFQLSTKLNTYLHYFSYHKTSNLESVVNILPALPFSTSVSPAKLFSLTKRTGTSAGDGRRRLGADEGSRVQSCRHAARTCVAVVAAATGRSVNRRSRVARTSRADGVVFLRRRFCAARACPPTPADRSADCSRRGTPTGRHASALRHRHRLRLRHWHWYCQCRTGSGTGTSLRYRHRHCAGAAVSAVSAGVVNAKEDVDLSDVRFRAEQAVAPR